MNKLFVTLLALGFSANAFAGALEATEGTPSRALQQARRVASMENDHDLPSRAVWLGQKAARNSKLAFAKQSKKTVSEE